MPARKPEPFRLKHYVIENGRYVRIPRLGPNATKSEVRMAMKLAREKLAQRKKELEDSIREHALFVRGKIQPLNRKSRKEYASRVIDYGLLASQHFDWPEWRLADELKLSKEDLIWAHATYGGLVASLHAWAAKQRQRKKDLRVVDLSIALRIPFPTTRKWILGMGYYIDKNGFFTLKMKG